LLGPFDAIVKTYDALKIPVLYSLDQTDLSSKRLRVRLYAIVCCNNATIADPRGNRRVIDANNHDTVIGEQISLYSLTEIQNMKSFAEDGLIVHVYNFDADFVGFAF